MWEFIENYRFFCCLWYDFCKRGYFISGWGVEIWVFGWKKFFGLVGCVCFLF